jgi:hypothetical protein
MAEYPMRKDRETSGKPTWRDPHRNPNSNPEANAPYWQPLKPKPLTIPLPAKSAKINAFEDQVFEVAFELADLLVKKHNDYGPKNISQSPYGATQGLIVRMWDKIARIVNLTDKKRHAENEPLEDSFKDLANYAIIGLMVQRGQWPNE